MNKYRKEAPPEEWWKYENLIRGCTIAGLYRANVLACEYANRVGDILSVEKIGEAEDALEITYKEVCDRFGNKIEEDKAQVRKVSFEEFTELIINLRHTFYNLDKLEPFFRETKEKCTEWEESLNFPTYLEQSARLC